MDYSLPFLQKKDMIVSVGISTFIIINNFSDMIDEIKQIIIIGNNEVLFGISSTILAAFIALFAFLGYIVTEKTGPLVNFIISYLKIDDKAFKLFSYIQIFNPEIVFNLMPYNDIKNKLKEGMSGEGGEKERFEIAVDRLKKINRFFRFFSSITILLLFCSLLLLFFNNLLPNTYDGRILGFIFLIVLLILSGLSLWYAFQVIQKLFLGNKEDEKIIKENFPEVFQNK